MAEVAPDQAVSFTRRAGLDMIQVSAWPATSGEVCRILTEVLGVSPSMQPNAVTELGSVEILNLAPLRWLAVWPVQTQREYASKLAMRLPPDLAAITEVGAGRCVLCLSGPRSRDVLAKLLPIDLSAPRFSVGQCVQSAIAHIGVLVNAAGDDAFEIFVYRSFARHLSEVLMDASLEFGCTAM